MRRNFRGNFEIVELLLTLGTPQRDCKQPAKEAIKRFKTLRGVLEARPDDLQEIPGIGPTRKRALLRHFGTVKAIERASLPDLAQVPGINAEIARKIYEFFHEQVH